MDAQIIMTEDGSTTLFSPRYQERYHSVHGALQESMHVFINAGLKAAAEKPVIRVFEAGFGTGLNALLTALYAGNGAVVYTSVEPEPVSPELLGAMNYAGAVGDPRAGGIFSGLHAASWDSAAAITGNFTLLKLRKRLQETELPTGLDVVYFDAFSPDVQPELWSAEIFSRIYRACAGGAVFVTYCAKGQVRRDLQAAGFQVEKIPGPPGKREMLRARKPVD